jgi:hypothetical protein
VGIAHSGKAWKADREAGRLTPGAERPCVDAPSDASSFLDHGWGMWSGAVVCPVSKVRPFTAAGLYENMRIGTFRLITHHSVNFLETSRLAASAGETAQNTVA